MRELLANLKDLLLRCLFDVFSICLAFALLGTFAGFFSEYNFVADIFSHFRVQYCFAGFILIICFLLSKSRNIIFLCLGLILLFINIFPVLRNINIHISSEKPDIKICQINILTSNKKYEKVRQELLQNTPDIIVLEELDDIWSNELYLVKNEYPFAYEVSNEGNFGIAIYSKIPIKQVKRMYAGNLSIPLISAICEFNGMEFEVIAIHTTPPISQEYFANTRQMLDNVSSYIESVDRPVIVAGDINSSFFSYNYKNFVKRAKLKSTGSVLKPTWAAFHPFFMRISLDHIFVTKDFGIKNFKVGKKTGSDHFPVYAEIYLSK